MTKEELFEEAKIRYPVGTQFIIAHLPNVISTVKSHIKHENNFNNEHENNVNNEHKIMLIMNIKAVLIMNII